MHRAIVYIGALAIAGTVSATQVVYPAKEQSPEQQIKDETECSTWAAGNSGYDPANPQPATQKSSQQSGPSGARLKGAARGAIVGEIADGDTGDAALAGAVMGGSRERRTKRKANKQAQPTADTTQSAGQSDYDKARAVCLEGRGYSVK
jgi:hypothetical protein